MDLVTIEKLRAKKNYRRTPFLSCLNQYCLIPFVLLGLLVLMVLPLLCSSIELFFVPFQDIGAFAMGPTCLFLVCNMIVLYLIGGSKMVGQTGAAAASPASAIYDEYVKERRGLGRVSALEGHDEYVKERRGLGRVSALEGKELPLIEERPEVFQKAEEDFENKILKGGMHLNGEEKIGLSSYVLMKRSEDFIARVNRQRRLEAERLFYSG